MMSLIATATKKSRMKICRVLGMDNTIVVKLSPNKQMFIWLAVNLPLLLKHLDL